QAYLMKYGYLHTSLDPQNQGFQKEDVIEALRVFQRVTDLPVTGVIDKATLEMMRQSRCGIEDPFNQKTLNCRVAIRSAFKYWNDVAPLSFREVEYGRADIRISFHTKDATCAVPFDGRGASDEFWTEGMFYGINLRVIAAHEIGHALGLDHSQYRSALIAPLYTGYRSNFLLHPDDVKGIQAMYGKWSLIEPTVTLPTDSLPDAEGDIPDPFTARLNAIMLGKLSAHNTGQRYTFKSSLLWKLFYFDRLWMGLPGNLKTAVYSQRTNKTYFFKEKNKKLVFFKGTGYWQWDELRSSNLNVYPKPLSNLFNGVPSSPDAAFTWTNGKIYFFKRDKYWCVNSLLSVDKGYPLRKSEQKHDIIGVQTPAFTGLHFITGL
uniref:Peptidase metallopeptidase domain-containing protein n=1 Tax=Oncorhynchus tshawytscha TaxID=74940 RepID=A0A8C8HCD2_ONCTS